MTATFNFDSPDNWDAFKREVDLGSDLAPGYRPDDGIGARLRTAREHRRDAYMAQHGLDSRSAWWAAMNDLCHDSGELGEHARRVRAAHVRAMIRNAALVGASAGEGRAIATSEERAAIREQHGLARIPAHGLVVEDVA